MNKQEKYEKAWKELQDINDSLEFRKAWVEVEKLGIEADLVRLLGMEVKDLTIKYATESSEFNIVTTRPRVEPITWKEDDGSDDFIEAPAMRIEFLLIKAEGMPHMDSSKLVETLERIIYKCRFGFYCIRIRPEEQGDNDGNADEISSCWHWTSIERGSFSDAFWVRLSFGLCYCT